MNRWPSAFCFSSGLGQEAFQFVEHGVDLGGTAARLVIRQQRVIQADTQNLGLGGGLFADQGQKLGHQGLHGLEVVVGAGVAPHGLAGRGRAAQPRHQVFRQGRGLDVIAFDLAQVGLLPVGQIGRIGLGGGDQIARFAVRQHAVMDGGQFGQLFGPGFVAAPRHHRGHVPMQDFLGLAQGVQAPETAFQVGVGCVIHRSTVGHGSQLDIWHTV